MTRRWVLCPDCRGIESFVIREGQIAVCPTCDGFGRVPYVARPARRPLRDLAVAVLAVALIVAGFAIGRASAAPRSGAATAIPAGDVRPPAKGIRRPSSGNLSPDRTGASRLQAESRRSVAGGGSRSVVGDAPITGIASWYDDGPGLYAAVPSWRRGDARYPLSVCARERCVRVVVRDYCQCYVGTNRERVIDLSPAAFAQLAPLGRGVVRVTVFADARSLPTPPATDWAAP